MLNFSTERSETYPAAVIGYVKTMLNPPSDIVKRQCILGALVEKTEQYYQQGLPCGLCARVRCTSLNHRRWPAVVFGACTYVAFFLCFRKGLVGAPPNHHSAVVVHGKGA